MISSVNIIVIQRKMNWSEVEDLQVDLAYV